MTRTNEIESLLESVAAKENFELVDIQYVKENGDWVLRIFIDKDSGVNMSDCEKMSKIFGNVLDKSDILKDSYVLEISSPGLNRILKKKESFKRFIGSKIRLQTFEPINNQRNFFGALLDFTDEKIKIEDGTNGIIEINFLDVKKANLDTGF